MNPVHHSVVSLCFATMLVMATIPSLATGFRLPDQDAFATGRGEAFVATADNPSAIYYNPAGISQLDGHHLRGGVYGLHLGVEYDSPAGRSFDNENPWHAVPQVFYTYGPQKLPLTFGLGVFSPFGLSMEWPQDTGFRTVATEGSLTYMTVNPVVAWAIRPNLSIAAGLTVNYAEIDLRQGLLWPSQSYDAFRVKGDGWDLGYNLGVLWKPCEKLSFGASFRSITTPNLEGRTSFRNSVALPLPGGAAIPSFAQQKVDAQADFPFPLKTIVGVSYRPNPRWNFEFNADYTDWNRLNTVTIKQAAAFPPLLPQNIPLTFDWESSWYFEWGATRYFDNGWHVSGGYIFNQNSVPDAHYTPLVSDLDRHFFSLGFGRKGKQLSFDLAYQFGYGPTRTVRGSAPSATGQTADGDYTFLSHALMLTLGYHF